MCVTSFLEGTERKRLVFPLLCRIKILVLLAVPAARVGGCVPHPGPGLKRRPLLELLVLLHEHRPDPSLRGLDGEEVADDVNRRLLARRSPLLREFDDGGSRPLHLPHVLPPFPDDPAHLARWHKELHSQPDVLPGRHEAFLPHLFEYEVLSLIWMI